MDESKISIFKTVKWIFIFFLLLIFFIILNFPEHKIRAYFESTLMQNLSAQGILLQKRESKLSFLWGVSYQMKDVQITLPRATQPLSMDALTLKISYFPLLFKKLSGSARMDVKKGKIDIGFSFPMPQNNKFLPLDLNFDIKNLNLTDFNITQNLFYVSLQGVVNGKGYFILKDENPSSWEGETEFKVISLTVPNQAIIPEIHVSAVEGNGRIIKGQYRFDKLQFGQKEQNSQDDIRGNLTGNIDLAYPMSRSKADLVAHFSLSKDLLSKSPFIGTALGTGRQSDGSFKFSLVGIFSSGILPQPIK